MDIPLGREVIRTVEPLTAAQVQLANRMGARARALPHQLLLEWCAAHPGQLALGLFATTAVALGGLACWHFVAQWRGGGRGSTPPAPGPSSPRSASPGTATPAATPAVIPAAAPGVTPAVAGVPAAVPAPQQPPRSVNAFYHSEDGAGYGQLADETLRKSVRDALHKNFPGTREGADIGGEGVHQLSDLHDITCAAARQELRLGRLPTAAQVLQLEFLEARCRELARECTVPVHPRGAESAFLSETRALEGELSLLPLGGKQRSAFLQRRFTEAWTGYQGARDAGDFVATVGRETEMRIILGTKAEYFNRFLFRLEAAPRATGAIPGPAGNQSLAGNSGVMRILASRVIRTHRLRQFKRADRPAAPAAANYVSLGLHFG